MFFEAPEIIAQIPDIRQIYAINEKQEARLDAAVSVLDDDIFLETMDETKTARWERMLNIAPPDTDTLADRRLRVQAKVMERMPFTYRVVLKKLYTLCPHGLMTSFRWADQDVTIRVPAESGNLCGDIAELLENVLPLNMTYSVTLLYSTYGTLARHTHGGLAGYTHQQVRDAAAI